MKKTNIFKIFLILNVSLVFCYNQSDYINKIEESLERKKRQDDCGNQARSAIAQNVASVLKNPNNPLDIAGMISGLTSSIFSFEMPSMCDLSAKLDQITHELSMIKYRVEVLANDIECSSDKKNIEDLKKLVFRFKLSIDDHEQLMKETKGKDNDHNRKSKKERLDKILELCHDKSEGIGKVLSEFQRIFFDQYEMKRLFGNCGKYQRNKVDNLIVTFKLIYIQMVTSIKFCSESEYGSYIIYDIFP